MSPTTLTLLQGAWGESLEENGLFLIKSRRIYFLGHMQEPVRYQLKQDSLLIHFSKHIIIRQQMLKLDKDSLVVQSAAGISRLRHRSE
ncbi:hypothetical protein [Hymenobacter lucidus]|uniref:GRAM domain-containing protein n=1 Tax=Hymenobacter lucidus TaxID=2880930 RepID=A0ABS8AK86_9BACT|nr:hypothetical protein [Hymenobacter lucidus]MCB2406468.1 hypothetical protein [Hymenobacter lucidus]